MATEPEHHRHLFHDEMDAQHKRDMEQLAKFGYKQDLRRSLGFFSTFAIAFSFISATNGFYALFYYGLDIGGPAGLIWQWPIIVFGQFMVALVFAEAASHYPLAGGIYQWAKRFLGGDYGWWVAWVFATALVVTVAAVAFGVAPIICSLMGWDASNTTTLLWIAVCYAIGPMILNVLSVKVTAFFNNIGTVTEIIGLVVIAIALYVAVIIGHGSHQGFSVLFDTTPGVGSGALFGYGSAFLAAMLTGAWVMYGFDTAGGLAEETVNPTREVPRAMLFAIGITAVISAFWLVAMVLAIPNVKATQAQGTEAIAYIFNAHFPSWVTNLFLISVCVAIFVCCLAIQAATTRLLFAYGRDKMIPASRFFGYVNPSTRTPMTSAFFVAAAAIVVLLYVNLGGSDPFIAIARVTAWATAGTYVAYQMVVFGGLVARSKGWPKDRAYFNLGRWGWPVNIIAFVYGVFMIINLAWPRTPTAAWYDNYLVLFSLAVVVVAGLVVYAIQKARGVDLSSTIKEIDESPAEAMAAEAMAAGEAGKILDAPVDPGV
ncbi:MAG TPA: amino acid permease [Thermoleophilia bacterium]|nr:amino acid permease [Thermoleophilia bacterium]